MARSRDDVGNFSRRTTLMNTHDDRPGMEEARNAVPHRTTARATGVIVVVTLGLALPLVWSFLAHRESPEGEESSRRAAATSRVMRADGEAVIELASAAASHADIATAILQPVYGSRTGTGGAPSPLKVQLQGELVADPARVTTIRAAVPGRLAASVWPALGEVIGAGRVLGQVSDARALVAPRLGTVTRVNAQPGELVQAGQELLQLTDFASPLVRVVWRADLTGAPPLEITVAPETGTRVNARARLIGAAPDVDTITRMSVYLYRLENSWPGARSGLPVVATIPDNRSSGSDSGITVTSDGGVLVPAAAVIQWQALAWVYVERGPNRYVRKRIMTDYLVSDGYLVSIAPSGLTPGDRVVVRGAQQLLSEEFRTQLQTSDPDEKK